MTRNRDPFWLDPVTPEMITRLAGEVVAAAAERDPEKAHFLERRLWRWTLEAIAEGRVPDPVAAARVALSVLTMPMPADPGRQTP